MSEVVGYRHAAYDTPWWANPSSREGRFHRALADATQYVCLHPLGPAAEMLRHHVGPSGAADADTLVLNLWAVRLDLTDIVTIGFDNCADYAISAGELIGEDYAPTQALADQLRGDGHVSVRYPSAALPGSENVALFGPRVAHPYLMDPISAEECPTGHLTDGARPAAEVVSSVRWIGSPHAALEHWLLTGETLRYDDCQARRW